jgi:multidrug efflux pump subunit AcrB
MSKAMPHFIVSLHYAVQENDPDKLLRVVTTPLELVMQKLERVAEINTCTSHGSVAIEIGFPGGATKQDLANVTSRIEALEFDEEVVIASRTVELRAPRLSFDDVEIPTTAPDL